MRNLTKTLAAVSLLMPVSAYPLGIGDIKLHSALNQKLDAEIALLVSSGEDISDIKVKLASPDKFDEAGVPWSYFLSKIKFKAITQADGSTVVKLSSKEALREPFLDFLLEVTWTNGNLYREFTVLVDPPVTYKKPTLPIIEKPSQASASYTANQAANIEKRIIKTAVGQYGPTDRRDSIWKIAEKTNVYDDVSIEQMMIALYEANPKAFYKKNVNALMAGQRLKVPEKNVILKLSKKQALAAFKQQDNVWRGRVTQKTELIGSDDKVVANQLELEAPLDDAITESVEVMTADEVASKQLVDSEISNSIVTTSNEGLALQARMDKLEQQLVMMQKILILKDEQIATLQNKKAVETLETAKTVEPSEKKGQTVESGQIKIKKLAEVIADKKAAEEAKIAQEKKVAVAEKTKVVAPKIKPVAKPKPKVTPKPAPVVEEKTDYLTLAIGGGTVIVFSLLGLVWWRRRQQAEGTVSDESMFATASEISLPDTPEDELSIPIADDSSLYDVGTVGESSFLSEFTPSDFDAFDTDETEVDPISEADVYLAYGRYQQAEDLMVQAIKDYPERDECKLKLLEIFHSNENKEAFEEYAKELVTEGKPENTEFWAKVVEMGVDLDPESSLYIEHASFESVDLEKEKSEDVAPVIEKQSEAVSNESLDGELAGDDNNADVDFDLSIFDDAASPAEENIAESTPTKNEESNSDENLLDFDLSVFDLDSDDKEVEEKKAEAEDVESVEFNLDSIALDDSEQEETKPEEVKDTTDIESFDFDFDLDEVAENNAEPETITLDEEVESEIDLENFDFSSNDDEEVKEEISSNAKVDAVDEPEIDDFDFDFDEPTTPVTAAAPVTELDASVSDLTDMDELETKLDLAKAYIDMGDAEAAKEIAEEVLEKGNAEQKAAAQEVLDQLK